MKKPTLAQISTFLSETPMLHSLTQPQLERLIDRLMIQELEESTLLFEEGDEGDSWYLILEGEIAITKRLSNASDHDLTRLASGDSFGEMALIDGAPRSATATTTMPTTLISLPRKDFQDLMANEDPIALKLIWGMARDLCERSRELTQILTDLVEDSSLELDNYGDLLDQMLKTQMEMQ